MQYAYNLRNLPTTITYPGSLNVTRGYDDAARLTSVQDWLNNTTSFSYDANSNLTTETLPTASAVVDSFTFNAADRLTAISDKKGKTTLFAATYTRDNANQLTSDSSAPSSTSAYKYTTLNQVCYAGSSSSSACSSPPSGSTAYAYDAADNLTQIGSTQQAFNSADEICWAATTSGACGSPPSGATTYAYDARGNRTTVTPPSGGATTLFYDQANRLTAYGSAATYAYNGDGLRMSKTVSGSTSQFLWDVAPSAFPLLLKDGSTAYVYGPGSLPLEQVNGSTVLWLHHDQLSSTRLVTDSSGTSQATYTFDVYGKLTGSTGSITNPLRFAGQYWDAESLLYYLRARYYDPNTGQFLSRDPAAATTREPYAYVNDNPLNAIDPTGLCDFWDVGCNARKAIAQAIAAVVVQPLNDVRSALTVVEAVHDHAIAGAGVCVASCFSLSIQAGHVSLTVGGYGFIGKGPYVGWASKTVDQRHSDAVSGAIGDAVGAACSIGVDLRTGQIDPNDVEIDVFSGAGWQIGGQHSFDLGTWAPLG